MNANSPYTGYAMGDKGTRNWYGPNVDPSDQPVPADLIQHYRRTKDGNWAYVCPHCRHIFDPFWDGMPGAFREHAFNYKNDPEDDKEIAGRGCLFKPPRKEEKRQATTKGLDALK